MRGAALNPKSDLIGLSEFEQYIDDKTDTVIYGFNKFIKLLMDANPGSLELLGLKREHYLILNPVGELLLQNVSMFLSKRVMQTFGSYADSQLRRLQNALAHDSYPQAEKETHILNSVKNAINHFNERYQAFESGSMQVYLDISRRPEFEKEIYLDSHLCHYPLRDCKNMLHDMESILRGYEKLNNRNRKKDDYHLNKHAMHLVRLLMTGRDILRFGRIQTWRGEELPLLLSIKNGAYRTDDGLFSADFYDLVNKLEDELSAAMQSTELPESPDIERIQAFVMDINEKVVKDEI